VYANPRAPGEESPTTLSCHSFERWRPQHDSCGTRTHACMYTLATCPTNPVGVHLDRLGHVEVDDVLQLVNVEPSRGHVRSEQDVHRAGLEVCHGFLALLLVQLWCPPHSIDIARKQPQYGVAS
jgi:hypothetical protein